MDIMAEQSSVHQMQCLEVWGGNGSSDSGVAMPGVDMWVFSRPYGGAAGGGDLHYVSSCGTGRISRVLVADVAGHGAKVSDLALQLRDLMRKYVNYVDQSRLVAKMNAAFAEAASASEKHAGRFATAIVATFWAPTGTILMCNAGHPRPLGWSAKRKTWRILKALSGHDAATVGNQTTDPPNVDSANFPLGIMDDANFEQFSLKASTSDLMIVYTDSLVESRRPDGSMIGEDGLLAIMASLDATRPDSIARELFAKVCAASAEPPDDDVTILVLRPNGLATAAPFGERVKAAGRFVKILCGMRTEISPHSDHDLAHNALIPWPEWDRSNLLGPVVPWFNRLVGRDTRQEI